MKTLVNVTHEERCFGKIKGRQVLKCRLAALDPDMLKYDPRSALGSALVSSRTENSAGGALSIAYGIC